MQLDKHDDLILVTGAGGFIGRHLVADLRSEGYKRIRAVDIKPYAEWYQIFPDTDISLRGRFQRLVCGKPDRR